MNTNETPETATTESTTQNVNELAWQQDKEEKGSHKIQLKSDKKNVVKD